MMELPEPDPQEDPYDENPYGIPLNCDDIPARPYEETDHDR